MKRSTILHRIKAGISEVDPGAKVLLYGSRARGDNGKDSDWDILVITPNEKITYEYESELRDPIFDLELEIGQIISLHVYSESDWKSKMPHSLFYSNIQEEGILLWCLKDEHIEYRIRRARETYKDVQILFQMGSINSSVNRLYYSAFYAAIALMIEKDIKVRTHKGVQQKLGEEFVLKGHLSKDLAKAYSILADFRHKGDYNDLFEFESEVIEKLFEPIAKFIDEIENMLQM